MIKDVPTVFMHQHTTFVKYFPFAYITDSMAHHRELCTCDVSK